MSKKKKTSQQKEAQRKRQKERSYDEKRGPIPQHYYCNVVEYDSETWRTLMSSGDREYYQQAKGIELGYLSGDQKPYRFRTFMKDRSASPHDNDNYHTDADIKMIFWRCLRDRRMVEVESRFADKFGSYSSLPWSAWKEKVYDLFSPVSWSPDMNALDKACEEVYQELRQKLEEETGSHILTPILDVDRLIELTTKGRNSGWPYFTSKWASDKDQLYYYIGEAVSLLNGEPVLHGKPHILFKRVQPNGKTPKMRAVECPPKSDAIAGKALTEPLVQLFKKYPQTFGFNGGRRVHEVLGEYMKYDCLVESDFSNFDATCVNLMPKVFELVMRLSPPELHGYLRNCLEYYQYASLITPDGIVSGRGPNGLMSGDAWTSVVGTLSNLIAVKYTMKKMGAEDYLSLSFGDDIAIASHDFSSELFEEYMAELGLICNKTKQHVTRGEKASFSFLGYYHFRDIFEKTGGKAHGIFPIMRLAPGLTYREYRFSKQEMTEKCDFTPEELEYLEEYSDLKLDQVALISKLNNADEHTGFEPLVRMMVREGDLRSKYILSPDSQAAGILRKLLEARITGRYARGSKLAEFPSVKLLLKIEEEEGIN